ncbi:MAG: class I SAM-dependent methyltransferase [Ignavibacterium sp.]|nr:class I SAM-dependent methyltransferase [Ignavibacterium sp.]
MKKDYRIIYYDSYNSTFNSQISQVDSKVLSSLFTHYDFKIFPYLKNFNYDSNILELGCGPGYLLDYLKLKGFTNSFGVDISSEQIEIAKSNGHNVRLDDVFDFLRSSTEKYDLIFAFDLIEHFKKDELLELTSLIYNHLNKNGLFIIRTPNGQGLFSGQIIFGDLTHQTIFTPNSLTQLFSNIGFSNLNFIENAPVKKNLVGFVRTVMWSALKIILNLVMLIEVGGTQKIWSRDFYCVAKK